MFIDTLVIVLGDQNAGKSNQIRTIFEEYELGSGLGGYPTSSNIKSRYLVGRDVELYVRLSSWHEKGQDYTRLKSDLTSHHRCAERRYKAIIPLQISATVPTDDGQKGLAGGEDLVIKILKDFDVRRSFVVWLNPDVSRRKPFEISPKMAKFMSKRPSLSVLAIDSLALRPSAAPTTNSINSRLLADLLFRA